MRIWNPCRRANLLDEGQTSPNRPARTATSARSAAALSAWPLAVNWSAALRRSSISDRTRSRICSSDSSRRATSAAPRPATAPRLLRSPPLHDDGFGCLGVVDGAQHRAQRGGARRVTLLAGSKAMRGEACARLGGLGGHGSPKYARACAIASDFPACRCADTHSRGDGYLTAKSTECQPVAPSGTGSAHCSVCVAPVLSVARTEIVCGPDASARHGKLHNRQASLE